MKLTQRIRAASATVMAIAGTLGTAGHATLAAESGAPSSEAAHDLASRIERFSLGKRALEEFYHVPGSASRRERMRRYLREEQRGLGQVRFDGLTLDGQVDAALFDKELKFQLDEEGREFDRLAAVKKWAPFAVAIEELEMARRQALETDPKEAAGVIARMKTTIEDLQKEMKARLEEDPSSAGIPTAVEANRLAKWVLALRRTLEEWRDFYAGYDPEMTWWISQPYSETEEAMREYARFLQRELAGFPDRGDPPLIGDPIGREALLDALAHEIIPYTPEELIEIAEREFEWCDRERERAAKEMGCDDWRDALERVKGLHAPPGRQPGLIKELAEEATRFLEERELVTIPPLCKETWRMRMMSAERQKVNPYFTGGEVISVSFPTDEMSHEDKLMSLRGNNIHFSRATVHHELIPGHHLQGFMAARYKTHRRAFRTPFLVEGWALYWEMRLWDLGFPRSPEDRIGMLFWRSHRCARIIFSLKFHLGEMTPQEAVDFLVERVGHERRNATAEVRRSVGEDYSPLYQAAYMLGGLQLKALHEEIVETGDLTEREFHDAVLRENAIPIEMIRARLTGQTLTPEYVSRWRFAD